MAEWTDEELNAAEERGRELFVNEPHARAARYDAASGMIVLDLYNGCTFAVPARQVQGLERASDAEIAQIEMSGYGYGLHWDALDADVTVPGLLAGHFGTRAHMAPYRAQLRATLATMEADGQAAAA